MGCLLSQTQSREQLRVAASSSYEPVLYTITGFELMHVNATELEHILTDIQLCPFEEDRANIIQSRLGTLLITTAQLVQILNMFDSDVERLERLKALFGNVSDPEGNWTEIYALFADESMKAEAVALTAPRGRKGSIA
jgi:hypothetical protein